MDLNARQSARLYFTGTNLDDRPLPDSVTAPRSAARRLQAPSFSVILESPTGVSVSGRALHGVASLTTPSAIVAPLDAFLADLDTCLAESPPKHVPVTVITAPGVLRAASSPAEFVQRGAASTRALDTDAPVEIAAAAAAAAVAAARTRASTTPTPVLSPSPSVATAAASTPAPSTTRRRLIEPLDRGSPHSRVAAAGDANEEETAGSRRRAASPLKRPPSFWTATKPPIAAASLVVDDASAPQSPLEAAVFSLKARLSPVAGRSVPVLMPRRSRSESDRGAEVGAPRDSIRAATEGNAAATVSIFADGGVNGHVAPGGSRQSSRSALAEALSPGPPTSPITRHMLLRRHAPKTASTRSGAPAQAAQQQQPQQSNSGGGSGVVRLPSGHIDLDAQLVIEALTSEAVSISKRTADSAAAAPGATTAHVGNAETTSPDRRPGLAAERRRQTPRHLQLSGLSFDSSSVSSPSRSQAGSVSPTRSSGGRAVGGETTSPGAAADGPGSALQQQRRRGRSGESAGSARKDASAADAAAAAEVGGAVSAHRRARSAASSTRRVRFSSPPRGGGREESNSNGGSIGGSSTPSSASPSATPTAASPSRDRSAGAAESSSSRGSSNGSSGDSRGGNGAFRLTSPPLQQQQQQQQPLLYPLPVALLSLLTPSRLKSLLSTHSADLLGSILSMPASELSAWLSAEEDRVRTLKADLAVLRGGVAEALQETDPTRFEYETRTLPRQALAAALGDAQTSLNAAVASGPTLVGTDAACAALAAPHSALYDAFSARISVQRSALAAEAGELSLVVPALHKITRARRETANALIRCVADVAGRLGPLKDVAAKMSTDAARLREWTEYLDAAEAEALSVRAEEVRRDTLRAAEEDARAHTAEMYADLLSAERASASARADAAHVEGEAEAERITRSIEAAQQAEFEGAMHDAAASVNDAQRRVSSLLEEVAALDSTLSGVRALSKLKAGVRRAWALLPTERLLEGFGVTVRELAAATAAAATAALAASATAIENTPSPSYSSSVAVAASSSHDDDAVEEADGVPPPPPKSPPPRRPAVGTSLSAKKPLVSGHRSSTAAAAAVAKRGGGGAAIPPPRSPASAPDSRHGRRDVPITITMPAPASGSGSYARGTHGEPVPVSSLLLSPTAKDDDGPARQQPSGGQQQQQPLQNLAGEDEDEEDAEQPDRLDVIIARRCINAFLCSALDAVGYDAEFAAVLNVAAKVGSRQLQYVKRGEDVPDALSLRCVISKIMRSPSAVAAAVAAAAAAKSTGDSPSARFFGLASSTPAADVSNEALMQELGVPSWVAVALGMMPPPRAHLAAAAASVDNAVVSFSPSSSLLSPQASASVAPTAPVAAAAAVPVPSQSSGARGGAMAAIRLAAEKQYQSVAAELAAAAANAADAEGAAASPARQSQPYFTTTTGAQRSSSTPDESAFVPIDYTKPFILRSAAATLAAVSAGESPQAAVVPTRPPSSSSPSSQSAAAAAPVTLSSRLSVYSVPVGGDDDAPPAAAYVSTVAASTAAADSSRTSSPVRLSPRFNLGDSSIGGKQGSSPNAATACAPPLSTSTVVSASAVFPVSRGSPHDGIDIVVYKNGRASSTHDEGIEALAAASTSPLTTSSSPATHSLPLGTSAGSNAAADSVSIHAAAAAAGGAHVISTVSNAADSATHVSIDRPATVHDHLHSTSPPLPLPIATTAGGLLAREEEKPPPRTDPIAATSSSAARDDTHVGAADRGEADLTFEKQQQPRAAVHSTRSVDSSSNISSSPPPAVAAASSAAATVVISLSETTTADAAVDSGPTTPAAATATSSAAATTVTADDSGAAPAPAPSRWPALRKTSRPSQPAVSSPLVSSPPAAAAYQLKSRRSSAVSIPEAALSAGTDGGAGTGINDAHAVKTAGAAVAVAKPSMVAPASPSKPTGPKSFVPVGGGGSMRGPPPPGGTNTGTSSSSSPKFPQLRPALRSAAASAPSPSADAPAGAGAATTTAAAAQGEQQQSQQAGGAFPGLRPLRSTQKGDQPATQSPSAGAVTEKAAPAWAKATLRKTGGASPAASSASPLTPIRVGAGPTVAAEPSSSASTAASASVPEGSSGQAAAPAATAKVAVSAVESAYDALSSTLDSGGIETQPPSQHAEGATVTPDEIASALRLALAVSSEPSVLTTSDVLNSSSSSHSGGEGSDAVALGTADDDAGLVSVVGAAAGEGDLHPSVFSGLDSEASSAPASPPAADAGDASPTEPAVRRHRSGSITSAEDGEDLAATRERRPSVPVVIAAIERKRALSTASQSSQGGSARRNALVGGLTIGEPTHAGVASEPVSARDLS